MKKLKLNMNILKENDLTAEKNREYFRKNGILAVNIMGSPGCGKTTLIEAVIKKLKTKYRIGVIEGDLSTVKDALRIRKLKVPVVQINTDSIGNACHLSSKMVEKAFKSMKIKKLDMLIIENIGNLVCPAEFDLGETMRISIVSVPEGDDKISKYPPMFLNSNAVIITKTDLLKYSDFSMKQAKRDIERINSKAEIFKISVKERKDIICFTDYIENAIKNAK